MELEAIGSNCFLHHSYFGCNVLAASLHIILRSFTDTDTDTDVCCCCCCCCCFKYIDSSSFEYGKNGLVQADSVKHVCSYLFIPSPQHSLKLDTFNAGGSGGGDEFLLAGLGLVVVVATDDKQLINNRSVKIKC
jgi:hypothetical protein